jgi:hypothetical protein
VISPSEVISVGDITKQVSLRLPAHQLNEVDERAEALGISRNQWFENMLDWVLLNTYTNAAGEVQRKG